MTRSRSRAVDHIGFIRRTLEELTGFATLAFELIQNADDTQRATRLRFDIRDDALWVEDDGGFSDCGEQDLDPDDCPFREAHGYRCDFHSFRLVSGADKRTRDNTTGAMGIGFTAVYQIADLPEIKSGRLHWIVDETAPEDDRITESELDPPHEGTRIILPWARDSKSPFRVKVGAAPVPADVKDQLLAALDEALAPAMLFLRNLEAIELALDGEVIRRITRQLIDDDLLIDDGGEERRWRVLRGDFADEADRLRAQHEGRIESARRPDVAVAVPIGFDVEGRLCATLPTATPSGLPVHISAELYLKSDRRQLGMGTAHHSDWNTAAIARAAELLAEALGELPGLLGPMRLWEAIDAARQIARTKQPDAVTAALGSYWECLEPEIREHELVWTSDERWVGVADARHAQSPEEEASFDVLEALGVALVHPALRPMQNILLAVDVAVLSIDDIAEALRSLGLEEATPIDELPGPLDDARGRAELWKQLGRMIGRHRTDDQRSAARDALATAAVVPSLAGTLAPVDAVWRTDAKSIQLLHRVAPAVPFLDEAQLPKDAASLADLCDPVTPGGAISELSEAPLELTAADGRALVGWFAQREDELEADDKSELGELAIFPSREGTHPLSALALPGDFDDPLDLALLVDRHVAREHGAFLRRLGVQQLSFAVYAGEQAPRAFDQEDLTVEQRRAVVSLLAQRKGELEDAPDARNALADLELVECTDGTWRTPGDTYLETPDVTNVLGRGHAFASLPAEHRVAVEELLLWLGVADLPRPAHVVARAQHISGQAVTDPHRQIVERIVLWLGRRWPFLEPGQKEQFAALRSTRWLPKRGSNAWHTPTGLDLVYRDYLYESQGSFIDVRRRVQDRAGDPLRWLGLKDDPSVGQVVDHLRRCAATNTQPNREVYGFLNLNADAAEISRLRDVACLHIEGRWLKPSEVFWAEHPFGRWRLRLGHEFARYRALFDELGVEEAPGWPEAISVMRDISREYAPSNASMPHEDRYVLLECWRLCEAALSPGDLDAAELTKLSGEKVVADDRSVLMAPSLLYFEDLPGLADELPDIRVHVIRRPDGAWRAMHAAGVRDLSKVAVANVVDVGDRLEGEDLHLRLADREEELARVIAPGTAVSWREFSTEMQALRWVVVASLTIAWELDAFGRRFPGEPGGADALWQRQEESLYVALSDGIPVWEAIARELVRALLPDVEPASLALGIAAALSPADRESARRALDAAGYAQLAPELQAEISTATATDLDADDAAKTEGDEEGAAGDEDASTPEEDGRDEEEEDEEDDDGEGKEDEEELAGTGAGGGGHGGGGHGGGGGQGGGGGGSTNGTSPGQRRSRLRSYVIRGEGDASGGDGADENDKRTAVDEAGIAAVVQFERECGRVPDVKEHNNKGFDVLSEYPDGEIARYIEVKSSRGPWDELGVGLSDAQFLHGQRVEDQYWLYVVEFALSPEHRRIWPIPDPARQVTDFMFDDGWKGLAEPEGGQAAPEAAELLAEDA